MQDRSILEITIKGVIIGICLSVVLAAANAYLGLFAGMTVSASIPAAVISMGLLRFFRQNSILENNIVQTAASAGEALAAGCIFTLPALVIMGSWKGFDYVPVTIIAICGGMLGVLFTIPLRRSLIIESPMQFPEGIAAAKVLDAGQGKGRGLMQILTSSLVGGLFKVASELVGIWPSELSFTASLGRAVTSLGFALSPALVAVGLIVGFNISLLMLAGGLGNWLLAIPISSYLQARPEDTSAAEWAAMIWARQTRYIGVGAMLVGGLWTILKMRSTILRGIRSGLEAYRHGSSRPIQRTDMDIPMAWLLIMIGASVVPLFAMYRWFLGSTYLAGAVAIVTILAGFAFSAVAGYMAGLVGSSNNPISGVTITTIVFCSLFLMGILGRNSQIGPSAAILIGATVCCAAAIAGDNLQDLKTGYLVGATPWRQQLMQMVGTAAGALVIAPVLVLLHKAYGFAGQPTPAPRPLPAPQANVMASVASGIFEGRLPWGFVWIGMLVAVALIIVDAILEAKHSPFRTPVLAVAIGIYLPLTLSVAVFLGGLIGLLVGRAKAKGSRIVLLASGLITGEAIMGIVIAIPMVLLKAKGLGLPLIQLWQQLSPRSVPGLLTWIESHGAWLGLLALTGLCVWAFRQACQTSDQD
ncbi:MAG: oligopeptide transporter, OPT family [Sedimentisphaerales bacterium]|jgi:putative OPT family oligopeptide transporter|nr:oligopeptide transporter, OPT family [Sedimentisphaerales bacterium]